MSVHFFTHIPKTAGTSFRLAAEDDLGSQRVIYDYGAHSSVTSACVRQYLYESDELDLEGLAQHWQTSKPVLIAGHKGLKQFSSVIRLDRIMTFFRDPLARCFSEYVHLLKQGRYEGSFRSFFSNEKRINRQLRMLSGVPFQALGIVGVTKRYRDSLSLINDHFSWDIRARKLNKSGWLAPKLSRVSAADFIIHPQRWGSISNEKIPIGTEIQWLVVSIRPFLPVTVVLNQWAWPHCKLCHGET